MVRESGDRKIEQAVLAMLDDATKSLESARKSTPNL
jgi:hypothetical protein